MELDKASEILEKIGIEKGKEIEEALEKYEKGMGFPLNYKVEPPEYIYCNIEVLRKKSPEELSEACFLISQYSLYIQRILNRNKSWQRYCYSKLDEIEAENIPNVGLNYGYNERPKLARNGSELGKKFNQFLRKLQMEYELFHGTPEQLKYISDCIRDIKFVALRRERENNAE